MFYVHFICLKMINHLITCSMLHPYFSFMVVYKAALQLDRSKVNQGRNISEGCARSFVISDPVSSWSISYNWFFSFKRAEVASFLSGNISLVAWSCCCIDSWSGWLFLSWKSDFATRFKLPLFMSWIIDSMTRKIYMSCLLTFSATLVYSSRLSSSSRVALSYSSGRRSSCYIKNEFPILLMALNYDSLSYSSSKCIVRLSRNLEWYFMRPL